MHEQRRTGLLVGDRAHVLVHFGGFRRRRRRRLLDFAAAAATKREGDQIQQHRQCQHSFHINLSFEENLQATSVTCAGYEQAQRTCPQTTEKPTNSANFGMPWQDGGEHRSFCDLRHPTRGAKNQEVRNLLPPNGLACGDG